VGEWRSVANLFRVWDEGVAPLSGTVIWPVLADRVVFDVAVLLSVNRMEPTWFLEPSCPSLLWKQLHVLAATAFTTILLALSIPARLSRSWMGTWSRRF
jgi:hypothetical protein